MEPITVWVREDGEWALVHRCVTCHELDSNRIAGDDNEFVLMSLAARAVAMPPFRLEALAKSPPRPDHPGSPQRPPAKDPSSEA